MITNVTCVIFTGMQRLPFFPENRIQGAFEPGHHWPDQGNRLRWVSPAATWCTLDKTMLYTLYKE